MVSVVSIVGRSGSGKTTLIEKVIPILAAMGYRVGTIKHDAHDFEIDQPGKDSFRHKKAGAYATVISSDKKLAMVRSLENPAKALEIAENMLNDMDLVIVEGYKNEPLPKIEVIRKEEGRELIFHPDQLAAIVTDLEEELGVRKFNLDDIKGISTFIQEQFIGRHVKTAGRKNV